MSANYIFNISFITTSEQIKQAIYRLLNDKVLKLNNISNKILKKVTHIIKNDLAQAISKCFISEMTSESFHEFITVILKKKKKQDYLLLSSYCLIVLKNTIAKFMKKLITE